MRILILCLALSGAVFPALAAEMTSAYTDFRPASDCSTLDSSTDEGGFSTMICPGWRGYPVVLSSGDLRESVFYGFPPAGKPAWESFGPFNATGDRIEWRILTDTDKQVPVATIHRWTVSDPEDETSKTEVLVVEKVGLPGVSEGCAVGLVVATGNEKANETARRIADESVADFACGADERVLVSGSVPLPSFDRQEN